MTLNVTINYKSQINKDHIGGLIHFMMLLLENNQSIINLECFIPNLNPIGVGKTAVYALFLDT